MQEKQSPVAFADASWGADQTTSCNYFDKINLLVITFTDLYIYSRYINFAIKK